jgi:hypothetical protein
MAGTEFNLHAYGHGSDEEELLYEGRNHLPYIPVAQLGETAIEATQQIQQASDRMTGPYNDGFDHRHVEL